MGEPPRSSTDAADKAIAALRGSSVATISAILLRRGLRAQCISGLRPIARNGGVMAGPAFTLRFIPAREDIDTLAWLARPENVQRRAVEECPPGSVLIIDAGRSTRAASAGDLMVRRLKFRGCAGIVTDGGFRDMAGIAMTGFPAYHREAAPCASPAALHPVETGQPIGCGGVAIYPGDIVVGDDEGVIIIPAAMLNDVVREAVAASAYEEFAAKQIEGGAPLHQVFPATEGSLAAFDAWSKTKN